MWRPAILGQGEELLEAASRRRRHLACPTVPAAPPVPPQRQGRHWYYSTHAKGMQYRKFCRRPLADPAAAPSEHDSMDPQLPEEVLLDEDQLAGGWSRTWADLAGVGQVVSGLGKAEQSRAVNRGGMATAWHAPAPHTCSGLAADQPPSPLPPSVSLLCAANQSYFDLVGPAVSPDEQLLAYAVDSGGGEVYTL